MRRGTRGWGASQVVVHRRVPNSEFENTRATVEGSSAQLALLDATAWSGIAEVQLTLATPTGMRWPAVGVLDGESTADFCVRVALLDPDHPPTSPPGHQNRTRWDH